MEVKAGEEAPGVCPPGGGFRGKRGAPGVCPPGGGEDAVMSDMRAIDDAEALKVWSELSELDPKIRGDTYVSEDRSQFNFSDLADDLRVMRDRQVRSREEREATGVGGTLATPEGRLREEVPMEVGTGKKRAAEAEADDSERTTRGEAADLMALSLGTLSVGKQGRGMIALSLLLAEGATVLNGRSQPEVHDQFMDGRGCLYLSLSTLDRHSSHG
eukprot:4895903-Amphidinium_carterae.1